MAKQHEKITAKMTDKDRARILDGKSIALCICEPKKVTAVCDTILKELETARLKTAKPILDKLAQDFGVSKDYANADIALDFRFSRVNLFESIQKQGNRYDDFARMLTCFEQVVTNAVGIQVRENRYGDDINIQNVYVLASGFLDGEHIVPVKLIVKELQEGQKNTLHVAVTRGKGKRPTSTQHQPTSEPVSVTPPSASSISIRQFVKEVNSFDGDFLKYFPAELLSSEQKVSADKANSAEEAYAREKAELRAKQQPPHKSKLSIDKIK